MLGRALVKGQLRNTVGSQDNVLLAEKGGRTTPLGSSIPPREMEVRCAC